MKMIKVVLADTELLKEAAFAIRREVFVVEQEVTPEDEFDEFEETSRHFLAYNAEGKPAGAARWRRTQKGIKLERFAVRIQDRGQGVGAALVSKVLEDVQAVAGSGQHLYMHAQLPAIPLYEKFDFKTKGDEFLECGIRHFVMEKDV